MQRLPLFPLNVVLYPGAQLPLHIFEQRYRLMIGRCIEEQKPFGVVLIREGVEIGGSAVPYLVGTLAEIESAYRLADGRMYIVSMGKQRFRINYPLTVDPYMVAMVTLLEDEAGDQSQAQELIALYHQYHRSVMAVTGMRSTPLDLPSDPTALSYSLADQMQMALPIKQRWLESTVDERLGSLAEAIHFEMNLLPPIAPPGLEREPPFDNTSWN
ncbi:MAG TPA: LON peptidase substrate-binding domain-containing protein [Herpetosiphonaceae bacterium]|nr:LON peptidase substrate-binding domain-containing protein [Herpetosiphonaceae bacterium]